MDAAIGRDLVFEPGRRLHLAVEDDRELAADVLARDLAELAAAFRRQREVDGGLVVLIQARPRVAEIVARHSRDLPHQVEHRARRLTRAARDAGHDFHAGWNLPVLQERFSRWQRPLLDDFQLQRAGRLDDPLRLFDVADAGKLHENLIAVGALLRDLWLGDAEFVDAPLDRLPRLHHGFLAQVHLNRRPHGERVRAVRAGAAVEVRLHLGSRLAELRIFRGRHTLDLEMRRIGHRDAGHRDTALRQLLAQPLALAISQRFQGIIGLHAQHEMDAAFEIEPELELFVHQPARRVDAVTRRDDRVDADRREHHEDDDDGDDLPTEILHKMRQADCSDVTTGSWP